MSTETNAPTAPESATVIDQYKGFEADNSCVGEINGSESILPVSSTGASAVPATSSAPFSETPKPSAGLPLHARDGFKTMT